jgi:hypothetical protein
MHELSGEELFFRSYNRLASKKKSFFLFETLWYIVGRDRIVGIATRYGLDGPGIESRWWRDIQHSSRRPWDLPGLVYNGYRVIPGGKAAGAWRWTPTPI